MHGYGSSLELCLPPLSVLVFRHDPARLPKLEEGREAGYKPAAVLPL
jgi:hypothetical protein